MASIAIAYLILSYATVADIVMVGLVIANIATAYAAIAYLIPAHTLTAHIAMADWGCKGTRGRHTVKALEGAIPQSQHSSTSQASVSTSDTTQSVNSLWSA